MMDDPNLLNIYPRLALTDLIRVNRQGVEGVVSGDTMRGQTRPRLLIKIADFDVVESDPGYKADPRGQTITATLPDPMTVGCREWQFVNIGKKGTGGKLRIYCQVGGIASPFDDNADFTEIILTRGQTLGIRSEICLDDIDMAQQPAFDYAGVAAPLVNDIPNMPKRAIYIITRS